MMQGYYGMYNNAVLMFWGPVAAEKVFVFMSLQDDYVRTWDENQGSNDSKLNAVSLSGCVAIYMYVSVVSSAEINENWRYCTGQQIDIWFIWWWQAVFDYHPNPEYWANDEKYLFKAGIFLYVCMETQNCASSMTACAWTD